jgi:hypothetical protein
MRWPIAKAGRFPHAGEWLGWAALAGLAIFYLAVSWRKWPDPVIDFSWQLYTPWRLSQGAVLYRDVEDTYGPFSQYLNAGLFRLFGPGMMVLVAANLVVFAGIVTVLYVLFRRAWGVGAAFVSSAIFIAVFGFAQYVRGGNYNYATPYAHEATHGLLVCLLLALVLSRWVECPTWRRSCLAGGLLGLTAVLKPEILLAAGVVSAAAWAVRWRWRKRPPLAAMAAWAGCAVLPTLAFALHFRTWFPWSQAFSLASRGWLNAASSTRFTGDPLQLGFLGLDRIPENLASHAVATLAALLLIAAIASLALLVERAPSLAGRILLAGSLLTGVTGVACFAIPWLHAGRCLLGLVTVYIAFCAVTMRRDPKPGGVPDEKAVLRLLLALLATGLLMRMVLNGRIYQYGYYQAALAGVLIPAILVGELPARLALGRFAKTVLVAACLLLLTAGVAILSGISLDYLSQRTYGVGEGRDRFYCFPPELDARGEIVGTLTGRLRNSPRATLLVLPEGEMINYLARMPSPVAPFVFFSYATSGGREAGLVDELRQRPPDWVALISRDLREYGIQRYGEAPDEGQFLLSWVADNYRQEMSVGGDPLDPDQFGGQLLRRRTAGSR